MSKPEKKKPHSKYCFIVLNKTPNNLIITIRNQNQQLLGWTSCGRLKLKGNKKINYTGLIELMGSLIQTLQHKRYQVKQLILRGKPPFIKKALFYFAESRVPVLGVINNTNIPYNGCRLPKRRRTR